MGVVLGLSHTRSQEGAQLLSCQIPKQEGQQKAWERFEKAGLPPRAQPKRGRVDGPSQCSLQDGAYTRETAEPRALSRLRLYGDC